MSADAQLSDIEIAAMSGSSAPVDSDTSVNNHLTASDIDGHDPSLFLNTFNLLRRDQSGEL